MVDKTPRNYGQRSGDARAKAEAAFRSFIAKPVDVPPPIPRASDGEKVVWIRVETDVLAYFQTDKDGWQDRMSAALRKAAGL